LSLTEFVRLQSSDFFLEIGAKWGVKVLILLDFQGETNFFA